MRSWSCGSEMLEFYYGRSSENIGGVGRERGQSNTSVGRLGLRIWRSEKRRIEIFAAAFWAAMRSWICSAVMTGRTLKDILVFKRGVYFFNFGLRSCLPG